jgi:hypothetical protein
MVHLHHNDAPRVADGGPFPHATTHDPQAAEERLQVFDLLPEPALLAAVGDLDLVQRLREHVHMPTLPHWSCNMCPEPWPCAAAKQELLLDLGWVRLPVYCSILLEQAAHDLTEADPRELWARFIAWTHPLHGVHDARLNPLS